MTRLGKIRRYRQMFEAAYPGKRFEKMTFAHASNAIAGFLIAGAGVQRLAVGPLPGRRRRALTAKQLLGAKDFMSAKCSICHNGPALTDNKFHNVAVAQIGPGKGRRRRARRLRADGNHRQPGGQVRLSHAAAPERRADRALRPRWRHHDAQGFVDHYSESDLKLRAYKKHQLEPLLRGTVQPTTDGILATRDTLLDGVVFPEETIVEVTEFMRALTDPAARNLRRLAPRTVPSGLPID